MASSGVRATSDLRPAHPDGVLLARCRPSKANFSGRGNVRFRSFRPMACTAGEPRELTRDMRLFGQSGLTQCTSQDGQAFWRCYVARYQTTDREAGLNLEQNLGYRLWPLLVFPIELALPRVDSEGH